MKYRKKPIIIEAYQTDVELDIETLEGVMHASIGDYIITGVNGEKYPCKPDIFEKTYELVEESNYKISKALEALEALEELNVVLETNPGTKQYNDIFEIHLIQPIETALKSLKTFEEELGIDLITLNKLRKANKIYVKFFDEIQEWNKIKVDLRYCKMWYGYNAGKGYGLSQPLSNYGIGFALTKEELENE